MMALPFHFHVFPLATWENWSSLPLICHLAGNLEVRSGPSANPGPLALLCFSIKLLFHKVNSVRRIKCFWNLDSSFAFPGVKKVWWVRKQLSCLPVCRKLLHRQVTNPLVLFHKHILNEFPKLMVQLCNGWHISRISWTRSQPADFWSFQNHPSIMPSIDLCALQAGFQHGNIA